MEIGILFQGFLKPSKLKGTLSWSRVFAVEIGEDGWLRLYFLDNLLLSKMRMQEKEKKMTKVFIQRDGSCYLLPY